MRVTKGKKQQINDNAEISAETVGKCCNKMANISAIKIAAVILLLNDGNDFLKYVCFELDPYNRQQANQAGIKLKNIMLFIL